MQERMERLMTERELLKKATDKALPDFEAVCTRCLNQTVPVKKQKRLMPVLVPAACAAVIALVLLAQPALKRTVSGVPAASQTDGYTSEFEGSVPEYQESDKIVYNPMPGPSGSNSISYNLEDHVAFSREEAREYYGFDPYSMEVPSDIPFCDEECGVFRREKGTGELYRDASSLNWQKSMERRIGISFHRDKPIVGAMVLSWDNSTLSEINGHKVWIACMDNHDGTITYNAGFTLGETKVGIDSTGLTQEEFLTALRSILK